MDDLYRENILEHYKRPHHWGELENPDMEYFDTNPLCGDELKVQIKRRRRARSRTWRSPATGARSPRPRPR